MADKLDGLIISELLVDNPSSGGFDTDGDGTVNKSDEFIEIQNTTGSAMSLDGYEIWSEKSGLLYSFTSGDTIDPGGSATILGEYTGTAPAGYYDAGAAEGTNWLADGEGTQFDSIFLVNTATGEYVVLSYGAPPQSPTLPTGFPGTTQSGDGESINSNAPNGTAFTRNSNGDFAESSPTPGQSGVPCYAPGTLIETEHGSRKVENLRPGDQVMTLDHGPQKVLWVHSCEQALEDTEKDAKPILIKAGALGDRRPLIDLIVSPQHRILVGGQGQIEGPLAFECLVAAKSLTGLPGVRTMQGKHFAAWVHFACARHEVVFANGCATETLLLGPVVLKGLSEQERREITNIFGRSNADDTVLNGPPARTCLKVQVARAAIKAHKLWKKRNKTSRAWDKDILKHPFQDPQASTITLGANEHVASGENELH